jgi:hypothetical protein
VRYHNSSSIVDVLKRKTSIQTKRSDDRVDSTRRDSDSDGIQHDTTRLNDLAPECPIERILRIERWLRKQDNIILSIAVGMLASHVTLSINEPEGTGRKSLAGDLIGLARCDRHDCGLM